MDQPRTASLTVYQQEIALLIAEGLADDQIGDQLALDCSEVVHHIEDIMARLGVETRLQVVAWTEANVPTGGCPAPSFDGPR